MKNSGFTNLMVIMKSMHKGHIEISVEYYSEVNYTEALRLAMKQISGDPIYLRVKQKLEIFFNMKRKMITYEITVNYANGRNVIIHNSFESIIDMIKNYIQYNDVKNMKVKPNTFISRYLG